MMVMPIKPSTDGEHLATKFLPCGIYKVEYYSSTESVSFVFSGHPLPQMAETTFMTFSLLSPPQAPYTEPLAVQYKKASTGSLTMDPKVFERVFYSTALNENEAAFYQARPEIDADNISLNFNTLTNVKQASLNS